MQKTPRRARALAASFLAGAALLVAVPVASAQRVDQDGLVNVSIGDVTVLENVDIGVAAQLAATVCGVKVGPVAVLGVAVDRSGDARTVCPTDQGPVTIENN
jgi:hypothetical protein